METQRITESENMFNEIKETFPEIRIMINDCMSSSNDIYEDMKMHKLFIKELRAGWKTLNDLVKEQTEKLK